MENNQAHKIDKVFKHSLDNQSITPPADAWMAVHTYTIGQEESKKRVWLRYATLALLVLLFSGLGVWYNINLNSDYETSHRVDLRISGLKTHRKIQKSANPVDSKLNNINSNISTSKSNKKIQESINLHGATFRNSNSDNILLHTPTLLSPEVDWSGDQPRGEKLLLHELLVENTNNSEKIENITPKPLIINDLSKKMQAECERKIIALEENVVDKKEVFKADSIVYGKRFSLKHPIITFGIFGYSWNQWNVTSNNSLDGRLLYPTNSKGSSFKLGLAWKVNERLRLGVNFGTNSYTIGVPFINMPAWSSSLGVPKVKLTKINSDLFYQLETPFGNANLSVSSFYNPNSQNPFRLDSVANISFTNTFPHTMRTTCFTITSQYDILSKSRKKGKKYNYQIYGLTDFQMQRQSSFFTGGKTDSMPQNSNFLQANEHLDNASEFVFGLRAGLGFRYQFAKKWDFYVEGSGQHSLNNWVKSDDIKTFQRNLSLQAGINLNL